MKDLKIDLWHRHNQIVAGLLQLLKLQMPEGLFHHMNRLAGRSNKIKHTSSLDIQASLGAFSLRQADENSN